jgi:ATP-binding cassette subfamily F protein 3
MYTAFDELISLEEDILRLEDDIARLSAAGMHSDAVRRTEELTEKNRRYAAGGGMEFRSRCRSMLLRLGFEEEMLTRKISTLSGGQYTRLALARLLATEPDLLMLDEPTNHLDIDSREALENALHGFDGTILVVSHDRYLVEKLATRILCLAPGAPFAGDVLDFFVDHPGQGYTEYERYVQARRAEMVVTEDAGQKVEASSAKQQYLKNKQDVAAERKRLRRIEKLHAECEALETELAEIEQALYGDAATDYERVAALDARKSEIEEQLLADYEELEELEA